MKQLALATATALVTAFVLWAQPSNAIEGGTYNIRTNGGNWFQSCSGGTCVGGDLPSAETRIITVPPDLSVEAQERMRKWEEFCKPTPKRGRYGVIYLSYAHEDCEYGRTE